VSDSDEELIERLRQADNAAFEQLFLRYYSQVYRVVYGLVGNREEAEDLAQETFLTLYYQPPAAGVTLVAWLCRVALNRGYNALRGQRRAQLRAERLAAPPDSVDPHAELLRAEERARVRAAIAQLPERQGQLLLLRHAGLSYAEIAGALGVAPGGVGTLLARAERAFLGTYERLNQAEHEDTLDTRTP
jgi:RNA polymerase sigma-70 factor (ECF subfamily)